MTRHHKQSGFTLIELMLAMGGIAFLLLFVVFAIMHVTNLYSKGVAIRQINQVGRQITDEIARELRYGESPKAPVNTNRLCVGGRSYIWNTLGDNLNKYDISGNPVGFVKVDGTVYCDMDTLPVPATTKELLGGVATILDMEVIEDGSTGLFDLTITLGTKNDPPVWQPSTLQYECNPIGGQFCAVGEFKTTIYARKQ